MSYLERLFLDSSERELYLEKEKEVLNKAKNNLSWIRDNIIRELKHSSYTWFVVFSHLKTTLVVIPMNPVFNDFSMVLIVDNYPISDIRFTADSEINLEECKQILLEKEELLNNTVRLICNDRCISFEYFKNCINLCDYTRDTFLNEERYKIIFDNNLDMTLRVSPDDEKMKDKAEKLKKMHDSIKLEYEYFLPECVSHEGREVLLLKSIFRNIRNGKFSNE